jgi:hypothetical protein
VHWIKRGYMWFNTSKPWCGIFDKWEERLKAWDKPWRSISNFKRYTKKIQAFLGFPFLIWKIIGRLLLGSLRSRRPSAAGFLYWKEEAASPGNWRTSDKLCRHKFLGRGGQRYNSIHHSFKNLKLTVRRRTIYL